MALEVAELTRPIRVMLTLRRGPTEHASPALAAGLLLLEVATHPAAGLAAAAGLVVVGLVVDQADAAGQADAGPEEDAEEAAEVEDAEAVEVRDQPIEEWRDDTSPLKSGETTSMRSRLGFYHEQLYLMIVPWFGALLLCLFELNLLPGAEKDSRDLSICSTRLIRGGSTLFASIHRCRRR